MIAHTADDASRIDWRRIAAFSTSFSAHALAALVLALPLLPIPPHAAPRIVEAVMRSEPPPPPPVPPETLPEPKPKPVRAPAQTVPKPQPAQRTAVDIPSASAIPVPDAPTATPTPAPTPPASVGADDGHGISRVLAYDGALKLRYPASSIRAREEGVVLLNVLVDAEGHARRVEIARGSGHAALDAAAREAVLRARFKPVLRDGVAVQAWGVVPIRFRLDEA